MIDPIAISFGSLEIRWYAVMWLLAFASVYFLLKWRIAWHEGDFTDDFLMDITFNALFGALLGGRLGYVFFYNAPYFLENPIMIVSPYDFSSGVWVGIAGMSYHGGLIGVLIGFLFTARKYNKKLLAVSDFVVPAIGLGYFFGRIGNFLNNELIGRETEMPWAMHFTDAVLRHPSQLYEALGEGIFIFLVLWFLRNRDFAQGVMTAHYIIIYGSVRFFLEFFRAPDPHIGLFFDVFSMGQVLSVVMILTGCALFFYCSSRFSRS